jgi:hypothetical protein
MKLAAVYNVFDGEELLPYSIKSIREVVDKVIIVYQNISNVGERHPNDNFEKFILSLDADKVVLYNPSLSNHWLSGEKNERRKRATGAKAAIDLGCTHFLLMDCDEFYEKDSFQAAKEKIIELDCNASACQMNTYYKNPRYKLIPEEQYYVPFIAKLEKGITRFSNFHDYPVHADPSRKTAPFDRFYKFTRDEIIMHHYTMVRKDMMLKFRNHSGLSRQRLDVEKIFSDFTNFKLGDPLGHPFESYTLEEVDNAFNIPECFESADDLATFSLIGDLFALLEKEGVDHWLSSGTFLSLYRENRFFPWDIDIDIDLNGDTTNFDQFTNIIENFGCEIVKKVVKKDKLVQIIFKHPKVDRLIDFYIWYERENQFYTYCDVGVLYYDKSLITNISNITFRDISLPCPPPNEYFTLRYGEDWRTPKRVSGLPGGGWDITMNLIRE